MNLLIIKFSPASSNIWLYTELMIRIEGLVAGPRTEASFITNEKEQKLFGRMPAKHKLLYKFNHTSDYGNGPTNYAQPEKNVSTIITVIRKLLFNECKGQT